MSRIYMRRNTLTDATFETFLSDINRLADYKAVRDVTLPELLEDLDMSLVHCRHTFTCVNRFEGRDPALRIQCPLGFMPSVIDIEFPQGRHVYRIKHASQVLIITGLEELVKNLRIILTMSWAHARAL